MKKISRRKKRPSPKFLITSALIIFKTAVLLFAIISLCVMVPHLYIMLRVISIICIFHIIALPDNPDYKLPWLVIIMISATVGLILYFLFYSRRLSRRYVKRLNELLPVTDFIYNDKDNRQALKREDDVAASQALLICDYSGAHLYRKCEVTYFSSGNDMLKSMLADIHMAKSSIFLEYYIIKEGDFLSALISALAERAAAGVDVRVLYDDVGCDGYLPRGFSEQMRALGISAVAFSVMRGILERGFNNRNHRKIAVIDGVTAYTGGVNIADEYIGKDSSYGRWKDSAVRLTGSAVRELSRLFMLDYGLNTYTEDIKANKHIKDARKPRVEETCYCIPFGDGPRPFYSSRAGKSLIISMLCSATESFYITTPYLITDFEMFRALENAAARGVDVRIVIPELPDKRLVRILTERQLLNLISAGIKIYLYSGGYVHAKTYIADEKYALVGTVNLDNRSFAHNFECGVWMYGTSAVCDISADINEVLLSSRRIYESSIRFPWYKKVICPLLCIFAPLF